MRHPLVHKWPNDAEYHAAEVLPPAQRGLLADRDPEFLAVGLQILARLHGRELLVHDLGAGHTRAAQQHGEPDRVRAGGREGRYGGALAVPDEADATGIDVRTLQQPRDPGQRVVREVRRRGPGDAASGAAGAAVVVPEDRDPPAPSALSKVTENGGSPVGRTTDPAHLPSTPDPGCCTSAGAERTHPTAVHIPSPQQIAGLASPRRIVRFMAMASSYSPSRQSHGPPQYLAGYPVRWVISPILALFTSVERMKYPARGHAGGADGRLGRISLRSGSRLTGKGEHTIPEGDRLVFETLGGGGYGNPLERTAADVASDVAKGLVSRDAAERVYGVVFGADGGMDEHRTESRRTIARNGTTGPSSSPPHAAARSSER